MELRAATTIDAEERFDKALNIIKGGTTTLVVLKNQKYAGLLTDRTISSMQHQSETKVGILAFNAPVLNTNMDIDEIATRFLEGYRELAVVEKGKLLGMVRQLDVLKSLKDEGRVPKKRVTELMSKPLITIDINQSLAQASALMRKEGIHHLIVTDDSRYIGIVSTSDVQPMLAKQTDRMPFARTRVGTETIAVKSILSSVPEIYQVRKAAHLNEAVDEMIKRGVSTLLVYDGKPIGLIHAVDIIKTSLPSAEPPLEINGLTIEEEDQRDDIRRECLTTLKRISKIMPIEVARLSIKTHSKTGSRHKYSLQFLVSGKHTLETNAFHWKLFSALNDVLKEMEHRVMKLKDKEKGKRFGVRKKRAASILIHSGELYPGKPV